MGLSGTEHALVEPDEAKRMIYRMYRVLRFILDLTKPNALVRNIIC